MESLVCDNVQAYRKDSRQTSLVGFSTLNYKIVHMICSEQLDLIQSVYQNGKKNKKI